MKTGQQTEGGISAESRQRPLTGHIHASSRHPIALRGDAMKTDQQTEGGISAESKQHPSTGQIPAWSRHRAISRVDDSGTDQRSKDSLSAESRQRPSSGQIPSWSNPPNVPWTDDPPSGDSLSLLPILYLLAPLVVTAMLMPIGATLITAIVMMKAHHQAAQGRLKSLFLEEDRVAPVYKLFEQNLQDLWQKFEEAIAKYNHGDMEHRN
ncbi:hypothetical protein AVEN_83334-1 [Araneus ventricosus]|uniref:Uncharacterized protein n=1 Tax=Araneus ventricosus TaxID=182803 RepID=A0A4Y2QDL7_ARAVE|nr:hypothetical protein AVEN_83334-1 [Araneus ventricosus]